jgi:hypothetical protein
MSEVSNLTQLAKFVGQSAMLTTDVAANTVSSGGVRVALATKPQQRQRVSDLLAVVLTLSARTRRVVLPRCEIDLDVFAPDGVRAARIMLPRG